MTVDEQRAFQTRLDKAGILMAEKKELEKFVEGIHFCLSSSNRYYTRMDVHNQDYECCKGRVGHNVISKWILPAIQEAVAKIDAEYASL